MGTLLAVLLAFPTTLMYHRVDVWAPSDPISERLTISPAQFARELRSLRRLGLHTIGIGELVRDLEARRSPAHAVLLTFDDGYGDQFRYAFSILRRYGDRATFFVNVATIGTPHHMRWRDVTTMARDGMSVGCHGVDHADLRSLGAQAQRYQIDACIRTLRARLGSAVLAFAYPSGAFDAATIALERRAGVRLGFTTDPSFQRDEQSPYELTRIRIVRGISTAQFDAIFQRPCEEVEFEPAH